MADFDPALIPPPELVSGTSKRTAKRDSLFLLMTLSSEAGEARGKARVRNLSQTGLMADCESHFRDGDRLVAHLRGIGDVAGFVTWVRGYRIGMAFDTPIDPQAARKRVDGRAVEEVPTYLRPIPRVTRFSR